jgi:hypothetical protein
MKCIGCAVQGLVLADFVFRSSHSADKVDLDYSVCHCSASCPAYVSMSHV